MKILVTGGCGFIGSNFIHYILRKYPQYKVINLDKLTYAGNPENLRDIEGNPHYQFVQGDICDRKIVEEIMGDCDVIVHFAAETHVDRSILEAGTFVTTDVYGTYNLLETARKFRIKKFIHISTDEVYGNALHDDGSREDDPLMPMSPYAASKTGADRLAYAYWATYGFPVIITRCSNNYGPFQYPEKLIPLFVTNALEDKPLPVYGDGRNTREWIYVLDHCEALDVILHSQGQEGQVFNIGAHSEHNVLEITETILEILGKPKDLINFVTDRPGHVKRHAVNVGKIEKAFGWKARRDFKECLEEIILWYKENIDWWKSLKKKLIEFDFKEKA